jgi:Fuc2NAc and GlcNAc transferase
VAVALAGAAAGFLTSNWPPAKLFLGDVGSTFLGFSIAVMPLVVGPVGRPAVVVVAALVMAAFVGDAAVTLLARMLRGENLFQTHRSHLYQRLVICGWPQAAVAAIYGVLAALGGLAGLALQAAK